MFPVVFFHQNPHFFHVFIEKSSMFHDFPMNFHVFSMCFPMVFPMVFPWFPHGFPTRPWRRPRCPAPRPARSRRCRRAPRACRSLAPPGTGQRRSEFGDVFFGRFGGFLIGIFYGQIVFFWCWDDWNGRCLVKSGGKFAMVKEMVNMVELFYSGISWGDQLFLW